MSLHLAKRARRVQVALSLHDLCGLLDCPLPLLEEILANPRLHYRFIAVPKANGKTREVRPPNLFLKIIQAKLLKHFYEHLHFPSFSHGGMPRRSIVTHASRHVGQDYLGTFDISDFFPSTRLFHIEPVLFEAGFRGKALMAVASLVMLENSLPQGAPTSGLLANLGFIPVDRLIVRLCRRNSLRYSRYVDDLALSGPTDIRRYEGTINQMISSFGYRLAKEKSRFFGRSVRQVITGLVVNDKLRPTKEFVQNLKRRIYDCLELGAETVSSNEGISLRRLRQQINGQVSHVRHVDEALGRRMRRLLYGVKWAPQPEVVLSDRLLA